MKKRGSLVFYQRIASLMILDIASVILASFLAIYIRSEFYFDPWLWGNYVKVFYIDIVITIFVYWLYNLYRSLWQYASANEFKKLLMATLTNAFVKIALFGLILRPGVPRSWFIMEPIILGLMTVGLRYAYRGLRLFRTGRDIEVPITYPSTNLMIVGAGDAGNLLLGEIIHSARVQKNICCFVDDDPTKRGSYISGIKIEGNRNDIPRLVEKYDIEEIYIAIPSAKASDRRDIINICNETHCQLKILPGIYQMLNGEVSIAQLKDVSIEDLLGRDPVKVNINEIVSYLKDQVVMVTGGGGSIGSEICEQVANASPKQLIIIDIYENNAYDIQQALKRHHPHLNLEVRIASIRDFKKMKLLFEEFKPDIVYHAAAHKHVPLMEESPHEAVKNNVYGTLNIVRCAHAYNVKRFVMISTDKAVNPTNIMGATKRACEMIIQSYDRHSKTIFTAVRFGNVLGSNGSVVPLFKRQIEEGGPVTITDKDIIRYFMTIPEAVTLVLQAGYYAKGGDIFVLDMGEPVRIDDMARNLIRLSGLIPDVDIPVVYTGLRPGEKLFEELLMDEEGLRKTDNGLIFIAKPMEFDEESYINTLDIMKEDIDNNCDDIKQKMASLIPTYKVDGH